MTTAVFFLLKIPLKLINYFDAQIKLIKSIIFIILSFVFLTFS